MSEKKVTVDVILSTLQFWVEDKTPIGAATWLDAAAKLTILVGDVQEELYLLEQKIAQKKLEFIEAGDSVAKAKAKTEALDEFVESKRLSAKIDRVTEIVRISKIQARMSDDNLTNQR